MKTCFHPLNFLPLQIFLFLSLLQPSFNSYMNGILSFIYDTHLIPSRSLGYSIQDLIETAPNQFETEASSWTVFPTPCSSCNKVYEALHSSCPYQTGTILGGPNVLDPITQPAEYSFQRSYTGLVYHNFVAISASFWYFGNRDKIIANSPFFDFYIDGNVIPAPYMVKANTCADQALNSKVIIQLSTKAHSASTLTLKIQSKVKFSDIQFGFRDVVLHLSNYGGATLAPCQVSSPSSSSTFQNRCICGFGKAPLDVISGSCTPCSPRCATCFGGSPMHCHTCQPNSVWNGQACVANPCLPYCNSCNGNTCLQCWPESFKFIDGTCLPTCVLSNQYFAADIQGESYCLQACPQPSQFRYPNGTCADYCPLPLKSQSSQGAHYCYTPCSINNQYLFPDGTCQGTCQSPWTPDSTEGFNNCKPPCPPQKFFLENNITCGDSCPSPLKSQNTFGADFCQYLCLSIGSPIYLYPDGNCQPYCSLPLSSRSESIGKFCWNPCLNNGYLHPDGSCHSSCSAPLEIKTKQFGDYCESPCAVSGEYVFPNSTCKATCPFPWISDLTKGFKNCIPPCPAQKLYSENNGTCLDSCPSPLISPKINGIDFCRYPCPGTPIYLYPDGICQSDCPSPLSSRSEAFGKFCFNPCKDNDYLYSNGSCSHTCPKPLSIKTGPYATYCENPCALYNTYLLADGKCSSTCDAPFTIISQSGVNYCFLLCNGYFSPTGICLPRCDPPYKQRVSQNIKYCDPPCQDPTKPYYFPSDGSCRKQCGYPYEPVVLKDLPLCKSILSEDDIRQAEKLADAADVSNALSDSGAIVSSLISSADSASATMGPLAKMLSYIKFMSINFPPKVQLMFYAQTTNSSLLSGIPNKLKKYAPNSLPPVNFQKYHFASNFFVNFWQSLFILGIIMLIILVLIILLIIMKGSAKITGILNKILLALKWNTFFTLFCGTCGDIVLFSALEFQTIRFENFLSVLSFMTCIFMNLLMGFTLYKILAVNFSLRTYRNKTSSSPEEIDKHFGGYKSLFEFYKEKSYAQQIFLFIFILRISLFNGIIGYLYPHPLAQAILIVLINGGILGYLLLKRPMKKLMNFIQQILMEGIIFVFNTCVLILAILDAQKSENWEAREKIGNVLIAINLVAPMLSTVLLAIKIFLVLRELYLAHKMSKTLVSDKMITKMDLQNPRISQNTSLTLCELNESRRIDQRREKRNYMNQNSSILNDTDHQFLQSENSSQSKQNRNPIDFPEYQNNVSPIQRRPAYVHQNSTFNHRNINTSHVNKVQNRRHRAPGYSHQNSALSQMNTSNMNTSQIDDEMQNEILVNPRRKPRMTRRPRDWKSNRFANDLISFDPNTN